MITAIAWIAAFLLAGFLFPKAWSRLGPSVFNATKSHAAQLCAMAAVFLILFAVFGSVFSALAAALAG